MIYELKIKFELNPIPKYIKFESELSLQELLKILMKCKVG